MKKLLGIVVLGLFWCNVGFAEWKEVVTSDRGAIYIDTQTVSKIDNKPSADEEISNKKQIIQKKFIPVKIKNPEQMNRLTQDIFKK